MASLALSVAGSAIGGPVGGMVGGFIGGLIDNMLFPAPKPQMPAITTSTYGNAIPLAYGPQVRLGANMIWTSGWRKQSGKAAKLSNLKDLPPAYVCDVAFAIGAGPWQPGWCIKIWANGNVLFDSTLAGSPPAPDANGVVVWSEFAGTAYKDFDAIVVYPGNDLQMPDPTIEAELGMGEVPAYRGTAYIVITALQGTPFGNSVPIINVLAAPQSAISLGEICCDIAKRSGIDPVSISTSGLTSLVEGYTVTAQTDGVTALQPLALCYDFDVGEVGGGLRFAARGQQPLCTITLDQLAGHEFGAARPTWQWPRAPEMELPKTAAITFLDPDRDCNSNTQSDRRATGSSQSLLQTSVQVTLTSVQARAIASRMLWEAHYGRQSFAGATDDRLGWLESARTYAIEVPSGYETIRIGKRTRGANGVIEFEAKRDAPGLYGATAPGASASAQDNALGLGGPVNPPVFIEPPADFPGVDGQAVVLIALSGGDGVDANPAWGGCNVYVATDDTTGDYQLAGVFLGVSCMGKLAGELFSYSGGNPDNVHTLTVDLSMSDGEPVAMSATDAQDAQTVYLVGDEYLTAQTVTGLGDQVFALTHLWRGRFGTQGDSHDVGISFVRVDSNVFRYALPAIYVGRVLYFRFVSAGENLAGATTYTYTPKGVVAGSAGSTGSFPASEAIAAGALVNIWSDSGVASIRNADATDTTKPADGYVAQAVTSGDSGIMFGNGQTNANLSGLTPGATYWLAVGGGVVNAAPATTGQGVQIVGKALSATELLFQPGAIVAAP